MLTRYQPQFVEQIFTDQAGRQFRLTFLVTMVDGQLKGRLVSAEAVSTKGKTPTSTAYLPVACPKTVASTEYIPAAAPVISPYNELYFFTSQPTRAPSVK